MKTAMKNTAQYRRARTTTRPRCQRFTFKAVRDTEGEILYYLILPYLMIGNNVVEGCYKENYHLTLKTSGEIGICNTCTEGNPADECRWTLSGAITGMTVTNCGESVNLGVDLDEESVAGVTAYGTDVWHVMPICLNVETEYQRTDYTCGAASATMIYNYLSPNNQIEEAEYVSEIEGRFKKQKAYQWIENNATYLNEKLGLSAPTGQFVFRNPTSSSQSRTYLSSSLNSGYPAIIHMAADDEHAPMLGYTSEGHYLVAKGFYYNPETNSYDVALNDPYYRFGILSGYKSKNVGGRDLVITIDVLESTMMYKSKLFNQNNPSQIKRGVYFL